MRLFYALIMAVAMGFQAPQPPVRRQTELYGKLAKFGIASPAVYAGRIVLGDKGLEKIRGKAIALHSQAITEFCLFVQCSVILGIFCMAGKLFFSFMLSCKSLFFQETVPSGRCDTKDAGSAHQKGQDQRRYPRVSCLVLVPLIA